MRRCPESADLPFREPTKVENAAAHMFDVGFSELVLLAVIGLLVLGPKRLPRAASELGKWAGSARRSARDFLRQLERETGFKEVVERPRPKLRVVPTRREPGRDDPRSV